MTSPESDSPASAGGGDVVAELAHAGFGKDEHGVEHR